MKKRKSRSALSAESDPQDKSEGEDSGETRGPADETETGGLEEMTRQRDEYLALLQRTRAEFSNYRKRIERERQELSWRAVGEFVRTLLPVVDDLDRALQAMDRDHDPEAFSQGIHLVMQNMTKVLEDAGISPLQPQGEPFDPTYHEAVMVEGHDELKPGTVSEVVRKGYVMEGNTLRAAQVKVVQSAQPPREEQPDDAEGDPDDDEESERAS